VNNKKSCYHSACEYHTCSTNSCLLEQYGRFCFMDTYGHKHHFRFIGCLEGYWFTMLKWRIKAYVQKV
jgi:hypothetical protein